MANVPAKEECVRAVILRLLVPCGPGRSANRTPGPGELFAGQNEFSPPGSTEARAYSTSMPRVMHPLTESGLAAAGQLGHRLARRPVLEHQILKAGGCILSLPHSKPFTPDPYPRAPTANRLIYLSWDPGRVGSACPVPCRASWHCHIRLWPRRRARARRCGATALRRGSGLCVLHIARRSSASCEMRDARCERGGNHTSVQTSDARASSYSFALFAARHISVCETPHLSGSARSARPRVPQNHRFSRNSAEEPSFLHRHRSAFIVRLRRHGGWDMCYCPRSAPGVQLTPHHNTPPFQLGFLASIRCENIEL